MKEFLNKLKTPTKILSIVCVVLVLMLFSKCNSVSRLRYENHKNVEQIDSLITVADSLYKVNQELKVKVIETSGSSVENENTLLKEVHQKYEKYQMKIDDQQNLIDYLRRVISKLEKRNKELEELIKSKQGE